MDARRSRSSAVLLLMTGISFGWMLAISTGTDASRRGDRSGGYILATGPVMVGYDNTSKAPIPLDAVYFLDHRSGRLLATVPSYRQTGTKLQFIEGFAERDLVADFKLDVNGGAEPRFLMTTGSLGQFSSGWSPLYVFEVSTGQVAVYRIQASLTPGRTSQPRFDLLELCSYPRIGGAESRP